MTSQVQVWTWQLHILGVFLGVIIETVTNICELRSHRNVNLRSICSFNLHWLRVPQRIEYKLCLVTYKALNDHRTPDYISDFCIRVADKRLRSSSKACYMYHGLPRSLATVPSLLQDPLHGTASPTTSRMRHRWRPLNPNSKLIFLNSHITAIKFLNPCTAPFPSALAVLRRYINSLIIIIVQN